MSARAERLARQFEAANAELVAVLESASAEQWRQRTEDEGELRAVGVIAHHVAWAHGHIARRVDAFARGVPVPARRPELFDERNARHAQENADADQAATLEYLRQAGAEVTALIAGLSDAELDQTGSEDPGAPLLTTAQVIELRQIGHVRGHLATIETAIAGGPPE